MCILPAPGWVPRLVYKDMGKDQYLPPDGKELQYFAVAFDVLHTTVSCPDCNGNRTSNNAL